MGSHLEQIRKVLETRKKYEELEALSKACFEVFCYWASLDFIINRVNNEWRELYKKVDLPHKRNVWIEVDNMKEALINRSEFKERMSETVDRINEYIANLKSKLEIAEKEFTEEYNNFFTWDEENQNNRASKYIYHILSQPEVRDNIMQFLES